jgi:hypothetical protein
MINNMDDKVQLVADLQKLMERFGRAGWVDRTMISDNPCKIDFTPLGTQRMVEMVRYVRDIEASGLEPTSVSLGEMGTVIHELLPPNFSHSEFKTLLCLIEFFGKNPPVPVT